MFNYLMIWKMFIENFNGTSFILDDIWVSNFDLQLYTDSAGGVGKGCGCYFNGMWSFLQWPVDWYFKGILKDITFLEIVPIALSIFLWCKVFSKKRIAFHIDNMGVVSAINSKSSKSTRVMNVLRYIVYWSMVGNFQIKGFYIPTESNCIADSISRGQFQKLKNLVPKADAFPIPVPSEFWSLLNSSL